jgi:hypothetical protein
MTSGGEYTFQTWIYISNYDYRAGQPKHVFSFSSGAPPAGVGNFSQPDAPVGTAKTNYNAFSRDVDSATSFLTTSAQIGGAVVAAEAIHLAVEAGSNKYVQGAAVGAMNLANSYESAASCLSPQQKAAAVEAKQAEAEAAAVANNSTCSAAQAAAAASCGRAPTPVSRPVYRAPHMTLLGVLYPSENKMMIRAYQSKTRVTEGFAAQDDGIDFQTADMTLMNNFSKMFQGRLSSKSLNGTMDFPLCDIQNIPLQKWVCLSIVMNGRVMDVYMDGKLARSCVLPGTPIVEEGPNYLSLGLQGGWGGSISTTRFYGYALTPGRIHELYEEGPDTGKGINSKYGFAGWLSERLGLRVNYSGL